MTRPRAADDFAAIHARLAELRREREAAAKQDAPADDGRNPASGRLPGTEPRPRPERSGWLSVSPGRRNGPARPR
ncbi:MAG TPA: hypothetical protein VMF05_00460 [Stellaceae bacterium]|nr:hypothetical protein [Stellaceae bacterium]